MSNDFDDDDLFRASKSKVPPVLGWTDPRTGKPMMHYSTVGENTGEADPDIPTPPEPTTLGAPDPSPTLGAPTPSPALGAPSPSATLGGQPGTLGASGARPSGTPADRPNDEQEPTPVIVEDDDEGGSVSISF